jgi:hypothetical protein
MENAERTCADCAFNSMESEFPDGTKAVDCELNALQLFQPYSDDGECKHWEKAVDKG